MTALPSIVAFDREALTIANIRDAAQDTETRAALTKLQDSPRSDRELYRQKNESFAMYRRSQIAVIDELLGRLDAGLGGTAQS